VPIALFALLLASGLAGDPQARPSELVGEPVPSVSLPRLGGGSPVDLGALRGQVLVVNFWASWCRACADEHPGLAQVWERYRDRGVVVVGADFEDTEGAATDYARSKRTDWPLVTDPGARAAIAFGVFGVPETYVIGVDGTVLAKHVGPVPYGWLVHRVEAALRAGEAT
jgi:cytochrome c biogenesis protein CcmG, thiol:disulfide interchange protein DsbE